MDIETEKMLAIDNLSQLIEKTRKAQEIYSRVFEMSSRKFWRYVLYPISWTNCQHRLAGWIDVRS